jgi:hypothetical protein
VSVEGWYCIKKRKKKEKEKEEEKTNDGRTWSSVTQCGVSVEGWGKPSTYAAPVTKYTGNLWHVVRRCESRQTEKKDSTTLTEGRLRMDLNFLQTRNSTRQNVTQWFMEIWFTPPRRVIGDQTGFLLLVKVFCFWLRLAFG